MGCALHVEEDYAGDSPGALDETDEHASPPEEILGPVHGDENSAPVDQDGCLDQWEDC